MPWLGGSEYARRGIASKDDLNGGVRKACESSSSGSDPRHVEVDSSYPEVVWFPKKHPLEALSLYNDARDCGEVMA